VVARRSALASDLLLVDFQRVAISHVERVRRILWPNAGAVKEEANGGNLLALALAKGIHQLLQLGGPLDLEEDFVVVVGHLDVEVLGLSRR